MSDLEFYIRLATGWACHHPAETALAVSILSISVLICWVVRAPLIPNDEPQDAPADDDVTDGIRDLGNYLAAQHITAKSRPAGADVSRHFDALLDGPAAASRNTRKEKL